MLCLICIWGRNSNGVWSHLPKMWYDEFGQKRNSDFVDKKVHVVVYVRLAFPHNHFYYGEQARMESGEGLRGWNSPPYLWPANTVKNVPQFLGWKNTETQFCHFGVIKYRKILCEKRPHKTVFLKIPIFGIFSILKF